MAVSLSRRPVDSPGQGLRSNGVASPDKAFGAATVRALPLRQQQVLAALTQGRSPLAVRAQQHLKELGSSPAFQRASPEAQAAQLGRALKGKAFVPQQLGVEPLPIPPLRAQVRIEKATVAKRFRFVGTRSDAKQYQVQVGDHRVAVSVPEDRRFSPGQQHSVSQVAQALARLPSDVRSLVRQVSLNPVKNPQDAFWAKTYGMPEFSSYTTAGADGRMDVFPQRVAHTVDELTLTMLHEIGHTWSDRWGSPRSTQWKPWRAAIAQDSLAVSKYGDSAVEEDVAEATALYLTTLGTPAFEEYRALYPHRFSMLDLYLGAHP